MSNPLRIVKLMLMNAVLYYKEKQDMTKKYMLINRTSGKVFRKAATREAARQLKREYGFKHSIVNTERMEVVR